MSANDGGPAFPVSEVDGDGNHYHTSMGMSIRDWFAGMALQGMLANDIGGDITQRAFAYADLMLAARAK